MTNNIKNICVFASSSNDLEEIYYQEARELGLLIGKNGYNIVYGGSHRGLMYTCASAVKENGGLIYGVMPEMFTKIGLGNPEDCAEFHTTAGMRERKAKLDKISDAVIAIPGGYGTLEEISEMIVQKQLGYNNKPIVILNTNNFYDKLLEFFDEIIKQDFAHKDSKTIYFVANTPQDAIKYVLEYRAEKTFCKY